MNATDTAARQDRLRSIVEAAYATDEPSPALAERVAAMAEKADDRARRRAVLRRRLRWATVAACAVALLAALPVLLPAIAAAAELRRIGIAMSDVRSAHIVTWSIGEDGRRTKVGEDWYADGCYRSERPDGQVTVYANGEMWNYDPKANVVHVRRHSQGPFGYNPSGFSVKAMASDFARWGWTDRIRVLGETAIGGRPVREVVIDREHEASRSELLVDPATDLPFRFMVQRVTVHGPVTERVSELTYNQPMPRALFVPDFGKTARVEDVEQGQKKWGVRLAKGITSTRLRDRTIVIRDFQVNAERDVFLLYTQGRVSADIRFKGQHLFEPTLADDRGTVYLEGGAFYPSIEHQHARLPNGYVFNGERLQGAWWVPLKPDAPWTSRKFTVTFVDGEAVYDRWHGGPRPVPTSEESATIDLAVAKPACTLVPEYMPYMALPVWDLNIAPTKADVRAEYYDRRLHDFPRALAVYREELEAQRDIDLRTGNSSATPEAWFSIYRLERSLGHDAQARAALLRARDDIVYPNQSPAGSIHNALKREGLE